MCTVDTHNIIDAQRTLLGFNKHLALHTATVVPFSKHTFQIVFNRHIIDGNKGVNSFVEVDNVDQILFHCENIITPLESKVKRGFELFLSNQAVTLDLVRLARLAW